MKKIKPWILGAVIVVIIISFLWVPFIWMNIFNAFGISVVYLCAFFINLLNDWWDKLGVPSEKAFYLDCILFIIILYIVIRTLIVFVIPKIVSKLKKKS